MGAVFFYHLTRHPIDVTLSTLIGKARERDWRVLVRGTDSGRLDWLDQKLWLGAEDGFLPHGLAGGPHDADQPVLLSAGTGVPNGATFLMSIDGADLDPTEVTLSERACILFDGHDEDALQRARVQWKTLTDAGCAAQYWSEDSGNWQKKAEKTAG